MTSGTRIHAACRGSYVLLTAVKDEAATIGITIESVLRQRLLPLEWVIVDNGSVDGTGQIIRRATSGHEWIKCVLLPLNSERNFRSKVIAINAGWRLLSADGYEFIGILDGDLKFGPEYFEEVLNAFAKDPDLGIAGGVVFDVGEAPYQKPRNQHDVPGAVQMFRRSCYEDVRPYLQIPAGGLTLWLASVLECSDTVPN